MALLTEKYNLFKKVYQYYNGFLFKKKNYSSMFEISIAFEKFMMIGTFFSELDSSTQSLANDVQGM